MSKRLDTPYNYDRQLHLIAVGLTRAHHGLDALFKHLQQSGDLNDVLSDWQDLENNIIEAADNLRSLNSTLEGPEDVDDALQEILK